MPRSLGRAVRALEGQIVDHLNQRFGRFSPTFMIWGIHLRRLGLLRSVVGGLSQYLAIPLFAYNHLNLFALYHGLLRPIYSVGPVDWRRYIVLDRHRIDALGWYDKLNCAYCGYANGLCTLLDVELDTLCSGPLVRGMNRTHPAQALLLLNAGLQLGAWLYLVFIWEVLISRPLRLRRTPVQKILRVLEEEGYGDGLDSCTRATARVYKFYSIYLNEVLEEIESSWCPIRHLKPGVFPEHHEHFFDIDHIDDMLQLLSTRGTVIPDRRS